MDLRKIEYEKLEKQHKIWIRSPLYRNPHLYNRLIRGLVAGRYEEKLRLQKGYDEMAIDTVHKVYKNPHAQHSSILRDFIIKYTDIISRDYAAIKENFYLWLDPPYKSDNVDEELYFQELEKRRDKIFMKEESGEIVTFMPIDLLSEICVTLGKKALENSYSQEYKSSRLIANKWMLRNKDRCLMEMFGLEGISTITSKSQKKRLRESLKNENSASDYESDSESSSKPIRDTYPTRKKMKLKHSPVQKNSTVPNIFPSSDESSSTDEISRSSADITGNQDAFTKPSTNLRSKIAILSKQKTNWLTELTESKKLALHSNVTNNNKKVNMDELREKRVQEILESETLPEIAMRCLINHYYKEKDEKFRRNFRLMPFDATFEYLKQFKSKNRSKSTGDDLIFSCISQNEDFYGVILRRLRNKRVFDEKVVVLNSCKGYKSQGVIQVIQQLQSFIPEIEYYSELDYSREFPSPISRDYLLYFFKWLTLESLEKLFDDEPCDMPLALTAENFENLRKEYAIIIQNSMLPNSLEISIQ